VEPPPQRPRLPLLLALAGAALIVGLVARDAWIADDAYFSFRGAWNLVHGYGPVWNAGERVQAFTNPLWVFALSGPLAVGVDLWVGTLALSLGLTAGTVGLLAGCRGDGRTNAAAVVLGVALLAGSRSFVDWSTSGLENPLLHALTAAFAVTWLRTGQDASPRRCVTLGALAAALAITRLDALLICAPALAWLALRARHRAGSLALGLSPLAGWLGFATLYYGSPLPNTALAKLNHGLEAHEVRAFLGPWLRWTAEWDPVLLPAMGVAALAAAWAAVRDGERRPAWLVAGAALYAAWLMRAGGDFMAGRLLTMPLTACVAALVATPATGRWLVSAPLAAAAVALSLSSPMSPLTSGPTPHPKGSPGGTGANVWIDDSGVAYERGVYWETSGWRRPLKEGEAANPIGQVRGATGLPPTVVVSEGGQTPYLDGPSVHHVDPLALGDPFLARLKGKPQSYRPGHIARALPPGYVDSVRTGRNLLGDPWLADLYGDTRLVSAGPLLRRERLAAIARLAKRDLGALLGR